MVKGISKQVIVVHSPDQKLFEQAIFILKENAADVTDEALLREAERLIKTGSGKGKRLLRWGPLWAAGGAAVTAAAWALSILL